MGLKKTCRKLMKLGKKAARKGSGERVEALLQNAIVALRAELEKRGAAKKEDDGLFLGCLLSTKHRDEAEDEDGITPCVRSQLQGAGSGG